MKSSRRPLLLLLALSLAGALFLAFRAKRPALAASEPPEPEVAAALDPSGKIKKNEAGPKVLVQGQPGGRPGPWAPVSAEQQEAWKETDRQHMRDLRKGILAYKAKHGAYPEYLSQLAPEYVSAETLHSPAKAASQGRDFADMDHPDPGNAKPSYGYEFSNLEFRDERTFAEIKEIQRAEWGDAIPLLRCFAHNGTVINMSMGGEIYETQLNWEWDPRTLDVVAKHGWGPGLKEGQIVKVRALKPDGSPASGAQVWADGRTYSFDLPNRPYTADADGWVSLSIGADTDRTQLRLRADAPGMASPLQSYPLGQPPAQTELTLGPATQISGTAVGPGGQPLANTWIYVDQAPPPAKDGAEAQGGRSPGNLATVKTDGEGRWQATVPQADAGGLQARTAGSRGWTSSSPINSADALAGTAVIKAGQ